MFISWADLRNPVVTFGEWILKDPAMAYLDGWFYLYFSAIFADRGAERFHISAVRTRDFRAFSEPLFLWNGPEVGGLGFASPDLQYIDGVYYLTYCTYGETKGDLNPPVKNQLYYATSTDGLNWNAHQPLAANLTRGIRAIDPTIARVDERWYLLWKQEQTPMVACADSLAGNAWRMVGSPRAGYFENAQTLLIDGQQHLLFSDDTHSQCLAAIPNNGHTPADWLDWTQRRKLVIPGETWNTDVRANAAFIADWRDHDGYFYAVYCGRTRGTWHSDGDYRLGLARSRDLQTWEPPGR